MSGASRPDLVQLLIGQIWIDSVDFPEALGHICWMVESGQGGSVFTPNVDHVVTAETDARFREAYAATSLSLADGKPLLWASRLLGSPLPAKVSGSDLVWPLMEQAAARRWRVYLLGGAPGVAAEAAEVLRRDLGVIVVGVDASRVSLEPPADGVDPVADRVRAAHPDLLLVALGAPKQELWIHRNRERIGPAVALGIGASLDFVAGRVRRAPRWMSEAGLEWTFRLAQEPRRMAVRYLWKDPRFLLILAREIAGPRARRVRVRPPRIAPAGGARAGHPAGTTFP
jgi:N-acetylglucosaminyldiphosphoundecaprenol N-acetyl-beta-D-mannosaminyltransferase